MGTKQLRFAVATVALGFTLAIVLGIAGVVSNSKAFGAATTLTIISGDVNVRHGAAGAFALATDGEILNEGDGVRTGTDGRAVLTHFEGSTVTIEPATELTIENSSTLADGGTVVVMTQSVGRTWHVVTKLIAGSSKYEVKTPASTASVRGTAFEVNSDPAQTTVSTTEGTVVARVADPARPGTSVDVPVTAGNTQTQSRNAAPAAARTKPAPQRKVTVTVGAANTLVIDPLGRANGVTKDGKLVVQTPGAQVKRDGDKIVITLPDLPDGRLAARVEKKDGNDDDDDDVQATIEDGDRTVEVSDKARSEGERKVAGFEIAHRADGNIEGRPLDDDEKQALPGAKTANTKRDDDRSTATPTRRPSPTPRATATPRPSDDNGRRTATPPRAQATDDRSKDADKASTVAERLTSGGFLPAMTALLRIPTSSRAPERTGKG